MSHHSPGGTSSSSSLPTMTEGDLPFCVWAVKDVKDCRATFPYRKLFIPKAKCFPLYKSYNIYLHILHQVAWMPFKSMVFTPRKYDT